MSLFQIFFSTFVPKIRHKMRLYTHTILRILAVILLLSGLSGRGSVAYALSGSGSSADPYTISSEAEWKEFAGMINTENSAYASSYFKLKNDISVTITSITDVIGSSSENPFKGTFDGQGHTLTINMEIVNGHSAPFRMISGNAKIQNLRVDGTIKTSDKFAGGIVGKSSGNETISNCICSVTIESSINGDGSHGGIIGEVGNLYSVSHNPLTIENCLFAGKLLGSSTHSCGGFVGAGTNSSYGNVEIKNCVFAPTEITMSGNGSATFSRATHTSYSNCYYITQFGDKNDRAQYSSSSSLSDKWVKDETNNPNRPYLETFASKVRITGWVKGSYYNTVIIKRWNNFSDYVGSAQPTFTYKSLDGGGYNSNQPPTSIAGHYTVTAVMPDNWTSTANFWVVEPPTANSLTYNRADQSLLTASTSPADAGTFYYIFNGSTPSTQIPTAQYAGDYSVSYFVSFAGHSGYEDIGTPTYPAGSVNVTIAPKKVSAPTIELSQSTYTYDKTAKEPSVSSVKDGNDVIPTSEYSVSYSDNTNAGTATVTVADKEGGNYVVNGTKTFTINPKEVSNPTITLSETSYVYDAKEHKPSVTVYDGSDLITSSEYTVGYSNNVSVGTDAKVTVTDNANGNYTVNGSTTFSITKEQLVVTVTANDLYYNYEEQELVTGSVKGSGTYKPILYSLDNVTYTTDVPKGKKVKTYKVYYKIEGDDNHIGTDVSSVDASIKSKKVDNPKIEISPSVCTYDGKPKTPDVRVYDGTTEILSSEFTVSYSNNTNVGTATVTITDVEGGTYTVSGTATFTIVENGSSYVPPKAKEGLVYTGKAQELIIGGSSTTGTMHYYSLDDVNYSTAIPKGTDAKTYTVYYKVVGDNNHYDSPATELTVVLSPKDVLSPTITLSPSTYTYDGTAKKPTVTVKDDDTEIPSSEYTVAYYNNTNIGKGRVKVTDNDGGNYCVNGSAIFYIVGEGSSFTEPTAKTDLTYNGKPQELITPGSASSGTMKYSTDGKKYSTSIPKGTDAKTYNVYYKVVDSENNDQTPAYSLTVTISQKSVTISVTLTDAGANKMPSITVKDGDGSELTSDDYTYVVKDSDGKEVDTSGKISAGDYKITVTPTGNYTGSSVTASFSVKNSRKFIFTMQSDIIGVCLPYNRDVPNNYQAYSFDRVADGNPVFKRNASETMTGGEPILLRYVGDQARTRATRTVDLSPSSPGLIDMTVAIQSQVNDGLVFTGTFNDINNTKGLMEGVYILQADDTWTHLDSSKSSQGSEICLEAFLTYFCYADHSMTTASLTTVLDTSRGDSPSAIHAVILEDEDGQQTWYDLNGHQIEAPQKGVNILRTADGKTKKVMKK